MTRFGGFFGIAVGSIEEEEGDEEETVEESMNKSMMKRAKDISVNAHRLKFDNREQYPIEWLLNVQGMTYSSNLDMIKRAVLCMDVTHANYFSLPDEDKKKADKLMESEDVVNMVLVTLFQWFGTNVGKDDIGKLLDAIRTIRNGEQKEDKE